MGQLVVDLDDAVVSALTRRAERHGRSVEDEHRAILAVALAGEAGAFAAAAALMRGRTPARGIDSADLVWRDRDHVAGGG
jgi:plasmid stability protein